MLLIKSYWLCVKIYTPYKNDFFFYLSMGYLGHRIIILVAQKSINAMSLDCMNMNERMNMHEFSHPFPEGKKKKILEWIPSNTNRRMPIELALKNSI